MKITFKPKSGLFKQKINCELSLNYFDKNNKPNIYDEVSFFHNHVSEHTYFVTKLNNLYGYINIANGLELEPFSEHHILFGRKGDSLVKKDGKWGIININDGWVVSAQYQSLGYVGGTSDNQGYIRAQLNDKYGFILRNGEWIIEPKFEELSLFTDFSLNEYNVCLAKSFNKYGFIDREGNWFVNPTFDNVSHFDGERFAISELNDKKGIIKQDGTEIFKPIFTDLIFNNNNEIFNELKFATCKLEGRLVKIYQDGTIEEVI